MKVFSTILMLAIGTLTSHAATAAQLSVPMYEVNAEGIGSPVGEVLVRESPEGLRFEAKLDKLSAGAHGFHVHEHASCAPSIVDGKPVPAGAAGGHWDPDGSKKHAGPHEQGHRGDLPPLQADLHGSIDQQVLAPRIGKLDELRGHALMIHAGGDNFSDQPAPLGGGGARMICGTIAL